MMDHPNIARVFDGGVTDTGRPYFVMELVRGIPIIEYCDARKMSMAERLELFMQVCGAVQHAHQKGIIHRDIKPSNILVTEQDGAPLPKVIDFGVAKALHQPLTDKTLFTSFRRRIGTPAYMSPEQAGLGGLDIDTRSDIYALGVLLYELLTGRTPFTREELFQSGVDEVLRIIREREPPKPSTRLSTLKAEELTMVAARRQVEAHKLGRQLRGELDWIVMKALEKDRRRRYETANGLARDLRRHLTNEPVSAAAPSVAYRIRKFAQRNKVVFSAGSAVLVALTVGIAVSSWQALRAMRAERVTAKERGRAEAALIASKEAEEEAVASERKAEAARDESRRQLRDALLERARSGRVAGLSGWREKGLNALRQAAAIRGSVDLRSEAIAQLANIDLALNSKISPRKANPLADAPGASPTFDLFAYFNRDFSSSKTAPTTGEELFCDATGALIGAPVRITFCDKKEIPNHFPVTSVFDPTVRRLALFRGDWDLVLIDVPAHKVVRQRAAAKVGELEPVVFGGFSSDGELFAALFGGGKVRVFHAADCSEAGGFVLPGGFDPPGARPLTYRGKLQPDGNSSLIAVVCDDTLEIWDWLKERQLIKRQLPNRVTAIAWSGDVVATSALGAVRGKLFNVRSGLARSFAQEESSVASPAKFSFALDGCLLSVPQFKRSTFFDAITGQQQLHSTSIFPTVYAQDGRRFLDEAFRSGEVQMSEAVKTLDVS